MPAKKELFHAEVRRQTAGNIFIIEIKSVDDLAPVHFKQLQAYLKLTGLKLCILVNLNSNLIKDGIHRVVSKL